MDCNSVSLPRSIHQNLVQKGAPWVTKNKIAFFLSTPEDSFLFLGKEVSGKEIKIPPKIASLLHLDPITVYNANDLSPAKYLELSVVYIFAQKAEDFTRLEKDYDELLCNLKDSLSIIRQSFDLEVELKYSPKITVSVLKCEPVRQGFVGKSTRIVISNSSSWIQRPQAVEAKMIEPQSTDQSSLDLVDTFLSGFMSSVQEINLGVVLNIVPSSLFPSGGECDSSHLVLVSLHSLASLGAINYQWVNLGQPDGSRSRYVLIASSSLVSDNEVLIGPVLLHNFKLSAGTEIKIQSPSLNYISPTASKITIAQIPPCNSKSSDLKHWFEQGGPRHVCLDDTICLRNSDSTLSMFKITGVELNDSPVEDIVATVDEESTTLVQFGKAYGLAPPFIHAFLDIPQLDQPILAEYSYLCDIAKSSINEVFSTRFKQVPCSLILSGKARSGKKNVFENIAREVGFSFEVVDCWEVFLGVDKDEKKVLDRLAQIFSDCVGPCILVLDHIEAFIDKESREGDAGGQEPAVTSALAKYIKESAIGVRERTGYPLVVAATSSDIEQLSPGLRSCFQYAFEVKSPNEKERLEILTQALKRSPLAPEVSLKNLALQTAAFSVGEISDLIGSACLAAKTRILEETCFSTNDLTLTRAGVDITGADFSNALDAARKRLGDSIGAPKIPTVTWSDIGGLEHVKNDLLDTIQLPFLHPDLFASGLKKRSGILLYGPPGTGKTLVAKAVATSFSLNFLSVKGPELLNMYIGESEQNVRKLFARARDAEPCVLFFDELDSLAPKRGEKGDSNGVMDRIVSQLLAELDGAGSGQSVFVIGATNRPELLDTALLRPGRFDKLIYLGISSDHETQLGILKALTRKFRLSSDLDLDLVAKQCPFNNTGADFYALCSDAMLNAMLRLAEETDRKIDAMNEQGEMYGDESHAYPITPEYYANRIAETGEMNVEVEMEDFRLAMENLVPSVSEDELARYERQRVMFEGVGKTES